jgi:CYTH domain-containing protein
VTNSRKYALVERERRFLIPRLPPDEPRSTQRIADCYVAGTRIRLRCCERFVNGRAEVVRKLTQKIPEPGGLDGRRGLITTMYLDEAEYERLAMLPGCRITKTRLSFPPFSVDVFNAPHEGLLIAEVEFSDDEATVAFEPPKWCGEEITGDPRYTGARLAELSSQSAI